MQGSSNGLIRKIKNVSPECVSNHSTIHREALLLKKLKYGTNQHCDLAVVVDDVVKIVNFFAYIQKNIECFQNCEKIGCERNEVAVSC